MEAGLPVGVGSLAHTPPSLQPGIAEGLSFLVVADGQEISSYSRHSPVAARLVDLVPEVSAVFENFQEAGVTV